MRIIENVELSCTRRGPNKPRAHTASHSCPVEDFVARSARALFEEGLSWIEMRANCDYDVDNDGDTDDIEYDDDGGEYKGQ